MTPKNVLRQRPWTDAELRAAGFSYYERKKQLVMARPLQPSEMPMVIKTALESLIVRPGTMICYDPGDVVQMTRQSYSHWPVVPDIFAQTYKHWDEPNWTPTPPQAHLLSQGCKPYYKYRGIWARQVTEPLYLQSLESPEPYLAPVGAWLAIGVDGEPWTMGDDTLHQRYIIP